MLLPTVIKYLWASNRSSIVAYCLVSIALAASFFYRGHKDSEDFNAFALVQFLNMSFFVSSPFLCRQIIYKNFQNGARYFFAPLPIAPLRMRLYEQVSFFLCAALPYLLVLPALFFAVYYKGLWSTAQAINFLGFQLFFWFVFANFALCLAMTGRLCWYLYSGVIAACNLYVHYNKNQDLAFLNFLDVDRMLYKSDLITIDLIVNYGALCLLFYFVALTLSYSVNRRGFAWLHAKETGLSGGIFGLFLVLMVGGNGYLVHKLEASKSEFSGLYLTRIGGQANANITGQSEAFWSSSVSLTSGEIAKYQKEVVQLHGDVKAFAETYQLALPNIHYQHSPNQALVKQLDSHAHGDNDLEIEFDFDQIKDHFADTERDIIIENLTNLSRGWIAKENKLIFLRGLATSWSWRHLDKALIQKRLMALVRTPELNKLYDAGAWLSIYQDSGACLFDALAANIVDDVNKAVPKNEVIDFLSTGLNLDNYWVPFHIFRSMLGLHSAAEKRASAFVLPSIPILANEASTAEIRRATLSFEVDPKEIFPKVFQPSYRIHHLGLERGDARIHFYEHDSPGRLVDLKAMDTQTISAKVTAYTPKSIMRQKERFSTTLSWQNKDLDCRVNLPWRYVEL